MTSQRITSDNHQVDPQKKFVRVLQLGLLSVSGILLIFVGGCAGSPLKLERYPSDSGPSDAGGVGSGVRAEESWSVALEVLQGPNAEVRAFERAREIGATTALSEVRSEARGDRWVVMSGRFAGPQEPDAQRALARAKELTLGDGQPFASAALVPPPSADPATLPDYDLRSTRRGLGRDVGLYTLQIGAYGRFDNGSLSRREREEIRDTAERAVRELRQQGFPAYYLHDSNLSVVTVGVFTEDDLGLTPRSRGFASPEFERLKREFPHNLFNGRGLNEPDPANPGGRKLQASQPVEIPR